MRRQRAGWIVDDRSTATGPLRTYLLETIDDQKLQVRPAVTHFARVITLGSVAPDLSSRSADEKESGHGLPATYDLGFRLRASPDQSERTGRFYDLEVLARKSAITGLTLHQEDDKDLFSFYLQRLLNQTDALEVTAPLLSELKVVRLMTEQQIDWDADVDSQFKIDGFPVVSSNPSDSPLILICGQDEPEKNGLYGVESGEWVRKENIPTDKAIYVAQGLEYGGHILLGVTPPGQSLRLQSAVPLMYLVDEAGNKHNPVEGRRNGGLRRDGNRFLFKLDEYIGEFTAPEKPLFLLAESRQYEHTVANDDLSDFVALSYALTPKLAPAVDPTPGADQIKELSDLMTMLDDDEKLADIRIPTQYYSPVDVVWKNPPSEFPALPADQMPAALDDVTLTEASRILVVDDSNPRKNGIYAFKDGAWGRAPDADEFSEFLSASGVFIQRGKEFGGRRAVYVGGSLVEGELDVKNLPFEFATNSQSYRFRIAETVQGAFRIGVRAEQLSNAADEPIRDFDGVTPDASAGRIPQIKLELFNSDGRLISSRETLPDRRTAIIDLSTTNVLDLVAHASPEDGVFLDKALTVELRVDGFLLELKLKRDTVLTEEERKQRRMADLEAEIQSAVQEAIQAAATSGQPYLGPPIVVKSTNNRLVISADLTGDKHADVISVANGRELGFMQVRNDGSVETPETVPFQQTERRPAVIAGTYLLKASLVELLDQKLPGRRFKPEYVVPEDGVAGKNDKLLPEYQDWQHIIYPQDAAAPRLRQLRYKLMSLSANQDRFALELVGGATHNFSTRSPHRRRDIILGGTGNDRLLGGSAEDWIFGGKGNDVLCGGLDGQASDILFGDEGNDLFQLLPDDLPRSNYTGIPFDPATADMLFGGEGEDQVYFRGGDIERHGDPNVSPDFIRDYVCLGYDRFLGRHRFMSLVWDTNRNRFITEETGGRTKLVQRFSFFQVREMEGTLVDTRGGSDVVHADPDFVNPHLGDRTWGVARGDVESGAYAYATLEIRGGAGQDVIYGSSYPDLIYGHGDGDFVAGRGHNDRILGGTDNDVLYGDAWRVEPLGLAAVVSGTPDEAGFDPEYLPEKLNDAEGKPKPIPAPVAYDYSQDVAFPLDAELTQRTGIPLVSEQTPQGPKAIPLKDCFALDGSVTGNKLSTLTRIGDFNGDKYDDFILSNAKEGAYVLLGPLNPSSFYRADTDEKIDPTTSARDIRIRGDTWSYEITVKDDADLNQLRRQFSVEGRSDIIISPKQGIPAATLGDIVHLNDDDTIANKADGFADVICARYDSIANEYKLFVLPGRRYSKNEPREPLAEFQDLLIKIPGDSTRVPAPQRSGADLSVHVVNFLGQMNAGQVVPVSPQIFVCLREPSSTATEVAALYSPMTPTPLLKFLEDELKKKDKRRSPAPAKGDEEEDQARSLAKLLFNDVSTQIDAESLFTATVAGDVDGDGLDDLLIGNSQFTQFEGDRHDMIGRVYLVGGRDPPATPTLVLDKASKHSEKKELKIVVWEGPGFGKLLSRFDDVDRDGLADFGFARNLQGDHEEEQHALAYQGAFFALRGHTKFFVVNQEGNSTNDVLYKYFAYDSNQAAG